MKTGDSTIDTIHDIRHYTGGGMCHYDCGEPGEFVVVAKAMDGKVARFAGCRNCLNRAKIYPIDNDWVDERTDHRHHV